MLRSVLARAGVVTALVLVLALASLTTSCGGGGFAANEMVLVNFLFVDRSLTPTAPTGTANLPRNAILCFQFSELVDPETVNDQTIQIRKGQAVPQGSFSINGPTVYFDPIVTNQGQPNPFGFDPLTQYSVDIPDFEEQQAVVRNRDRDPNLATFFTTFVTSNGYLRELVPPEVERVFFIPDPDALTGQIPGQGLLAVQFSEAMDPASFILGGSGGPTPGVTSIDVRYLPTAQINKDNNLVICTSGPDVNTCPESDLVGAPIPGFFTYDAAAAVFFFNPTFSFGDKKFEFTIQLFQGLKDLSGNLLVNPRSFGPFTCDGEGRETGLILAEDFLSTQNVDFSMTDADWGFTEEGVLQGQPITSRNAYIFGYSFVDPNSPNTKSGQYAAIAQPLVGAALNNVPGFNPVPPTSQGRRVLWAFSDGEMGVNGTVTAAGWGPDSNALFAANYPQVFLRCGFQKSSSMNLAPSFSGNYDGSPTIVYTGTYSVIQAQNIGNTPGHPVYPDPANYTVNPFPPCSANPAPYNGDLFTYTGFYGWPDFTTFFEWDEGDPNVSGDSVFLFDASAAESPGTWQQVRGYFASTFPCSGVLQGGFPNRRMYTVFEDDQPIPQTNWGAGVLNPEPSVTDSCFTITKRVSIAQTLFYTDGTQPANSLAQTFGPDTDYLLPLIEPSVQSGGAQVRVEYQGAFSIEADRRTINQAAPFTSWTEDIDDCDGFPCVRARIRLISNLISQERARLTSFIIPMLSTN